MDMRRLIGFMAVEVEAVRAASQDSRHGTPTRVIWNVPFFSRDHPEPKHFQGLDELLPVGEARCCLDNVALPIEFESQMCLANDTVQPPEQPAHAGTTLKSKKPSVAWPICCNFWFGRDIPYSTCLPRFLDFGDNLV